MVRPDPHPWHHRQNVQPLHELLHRIRWDAEFGRGTFALGYDDRVLGRERVVPFASARLDPGGFSFSVDDEDGPPAHVPLHRVRTVYKNGVVIWQRASRPESRR